MFNYCSWIRTAEGRSTSSILFSVPQTWRFQVLLGLLALLKVQMLQNRARVTALLFFRLIQTVENLCIYKHKGCGAVLFHAGRSSLNAADEKGSRSVRNNPGLKQRVLGEVPCWLYVQFLRFVTSHNTTGDVTEQWHGKFFQLITSLLFRSGQKQRESLQFWPRLNRVILRSAR